MSEDERILWIKVAESLGFKYTDHDGFINLENSCYYLFDDNRTISMLHGLACLECRGSVTASGRPDIWFYSCKAESSSTDSHPAALLRMLTAHEEAM